MEATVRSQQLGLRLQTHHGADRWFKNPTVMWGNSAPKSWPLAPNSKKNGEFVNSEICLMCGKVCGMIAMACTWIVGLLSRRQTWSAEYRLNWCIPRALCPEQPRIWIESHPQGELLLLQTYGGWKKSCTTWVAWNPMNNGINQLSTGAGSLPSTVLSISLSVYLSIFLAVSWSVCLSVYLSIHLLFLSFLSIDGSIYLSIHMHICMTHIQYVYIRNNYVYIYIKIIVYTYTLHIYI